MPALAQEASNPGCCRSKIPTRNPARDNSSAIAPPITPPPAMATSNFFTTLSYLIPSPPFMRATPSGSSNQWMVLNRSKKFGTTAAFDGQNKKAVPESEGDEVLRQKTAGARGSARCTGNMRLHSGSNPGRTRVPSRRTASRASASRPGILPRGLAHAEIRDQERCGAYLC